MPFTNRCQREELSYFYFQFIDVYIKHTLLHITHQGNQKNTQIRYISKLCHFHMSQFYILYARLPLETSTGRNAELLVGNRLIKLNKIAL